jgi:hypothetical protein
MSTKEEKTAEAETMTGTGPEARGQKSADTLEEAMAMQDKLAREANGTLTEDQMSEQRQLDEEERAKLEEAGAALEARDDAVYGREPGGEDRRVGYAEVPGMDPEEAATGPSPEVEEPTHASQTKVKK